MSDIPMYQDARFMPIWQSRLPTRPGLGLVVLPIVDLFFIMLIFLMIGSSLVFHHGIPVEVPEVADPSSGIGAKLVITLTKDNQLYFNDTIIDSDDQLENELARNGKTVPKPTIILRADGAATHNKVMRIQAIARKHCSRLFVVTQDGN